jgi:ATP-dependent Lon protease
MDCMEVVRIAGYTEDEKFEIAQASDPARDRQARPQRWGMGEQRYTRAAGVRNQHRRHRQSARPQAHHVP